MPWSASRCWCLLDRITRIQSRRVRLIIIASCVCGFRNFLSCVGGLSSQQVSSAPASVTQAQVESLLRLGRSWHPIYSTTYWQIAIMPPSWLLSWRRQRSYGGFFSFPRHWPPAIKARSYWCCVLPAQSAESCPLLWQEVLQQYYINSINTSTCRQV